MWTCLVQLRSGPDCYNLSIVLLHAAAARCGFHHSNMIHNRTCGRKLEGATLALLHVVIVL